MNRNEIETLYNKKQNDLIDFNSLMNYYKTEEEERKKFHEKMSKEYNLLGFYNKTISKISGRDIVKPPNPITVRTKRLAIMEKVRYLKSNNPLNKYTYTSEVDPNDRRYGRIDWYLNEYEKITMQSIIYNHEYLTNINLPYEEINSVLASSIEYVYKNKDDYTEYDIIDNFCYHNNLISRLNDVITENIIKIFNNNPCGQYINETIDKYPYYRSSALIEAVEFLSSCSESDRENILNCLIMMNLPYNVKIVRTISC
jgi:hypothetical protein